MSLMQRTHCGNKAYTMSFTAMFGQSFAKQTDFTNYFHLFHVMNIKSCKVTQIL